MGIEVIKNILNVFLWHFCTLHSFEQKTKKIVLAEIYFVIYFQDCARCATKEACKSLNYGKMKKKNGKICYFIHLSKSSKQM